MRARAIVSPLSGTGEHGVGDVRGRRWTRLWLGSSDVLDSLDSLDLGKPWRPGLDTSDLLQPALGSGKSSEKMRPIARDLNK